MERRQTDQPLGSTTAPSTPAVVANSRPQPEAQPPASLSAGFFFQVLNGLIDPMFIKDRQHRWVLVNDALCHLIGQARSNLIGKSDYDCFAKAQAEAFWQQDELIFTTGVANETEALLTSATGDPLWLSIKRSLIHDEAGEPFLVAIMRDVTPYRQIETDLQVAQQKFQLVIDNIPQLIFWKDRDSVFLGCNQAAAKVAGLPSSQAIVGKTDYDLPWTTSEADWYRECDRRVMASEQPELHIIETQQQTDGRQAWLDTNKIPLRDPAGNVVGILVTIEDITDRKRTDAALQHSEEHFRSLTTNIPLAVYRSLCDDDWTIGYMSDFFEDLTGYPVSDFIHAHVRTWASVIHPDDLAMLKQTVEAALAARQPFEMEYRIRHCDGSLRWVHEKGQGKFDESDNLLYLFGAILDITDRKQAEAALQQLNEELEQRVFDRTAQLEQEIHERERTGTKLRESQQRLTLLIEQTPLAVIEWNTNLELTDWNSAAEQIFGYSRSEALGQTPSFLLSAADRELVHQSLTQVVLKQRRSLHGVETNVTKSGGRIVCEWHDYPLIAADGTVVGFASIAQDVTARQRTEAALKQSEARLRQRAEELQHTLQELQRAQAQLVQSEKMSSLGQLVAGVAHEINNPVNFISGNLSHAKQYIEDLIRLLQLYQRHELNPAPIVQAEAEAIDLDFLLEDLPKLFNSMSFGVDRIQRIVRSLRNFSRMDEAEKKAVDLHDGLDSTLIILQSRLKASPNRCEIKISKHYGQLPDIECYASQLNQVFMNLISNAIEAIEERLTLLPTLSPRICIFTELIDTQVQIRITDNGAGIPPRVLSRLFDPFFTTKPIGKGTGMGLSISYQIVTEKHGGSLECRSTVGEGTEFTIKIPIGKRGTAQPQQPTNP